MSTLDDKLLPIVENILESNNNKDVYDLSLIQLYTLYRISSCLYYHYDKSIMPDGKFDLICKTLLDNYDPAWVHVTKDELKAGTGFSIRHGTTTHNICNLIIRLEEVITK